MSKRSLRASAEGAQLLRKAFTRKGWTQERLATEVNLKTRQPIWRCFTCQPIERHIFIEICTVLDLHWWEIVDTPPDPTLDLDLTSQSYLAQLDTLVQQLRQQRYDRVQAQCSTLRLLNIHYPVPLEQIYIDTKVLTHVPMRQALTDGSNQPSIVACPLMTDPLSAPLQVASETSLDAPWQPDSDSSHRLALPLVTPHAKLRLLGAPGSGKTTFLCYLAYLCNQGLWQPSQIPLLLKLRDVAATSVPFSLVDTIRQELNSTHGFDPQAIEAVLHTGHLLLLLDGLDEVPIPQRHHFFREISRFSDRYYKNPIVLSCRTATPCQLTNFTDLEIAPLDAEQIASFVQHWFHTFTYPSSTTATTFLQQLNQPDHAPLRDLATNPLYLHYLCYTCQQTGRFPDNRADFYRHCLDLPLRKWDALRGIDRAASVSLSHQIRLLTYLAQQTYDQPHPYLEQAHLERHIRAFLHTHPPADPETLQLQSEQLLQSIALHHGLLVESAPHLYTFSHIAFQEYLTARSITTTPDLDAALDRLLTYRHDPHWHPIFPLVTTLLWYADPLLDRLQHQIHTHLQQHPALTHFLTWQTQHALSYGETLSWQAIVDRVLQQLLSTAQSLTSTTLPHYQVQLHHALHLTLDTPLHAQLHSLPPPPLDNSTEFPNWLDRLQTVIIQPFSWQTSHHQRAIDTYHQLVILLHRCLQQPCTLSPTLQQTLDSFIIPTAWRPALVMPPSPVVKKRQEQQGQQNVVLQTQTARLEI